MGSKLAVVAVGLLAVATVCGVGAGQGEGAESAYTPPRVVVAVFSGGGPVDWALVLFDHDVAPEAVKQRLTRLGELCKSEVWDLKITHDPFVSVWQEGEDKEAGRDKSVGVIQTTARFGMAGLSDWKAGTLAVKPFVEAFKQDLPLRVVYNVSEEFHFKGPTQNEFRVDGARVEHYAGPTSHLFDVLPASEPAPSAAAARVAAAPPAPAGPWAGVMIGLTIAIAITALTLIGLIAYAAHTQHAASGRRPAPETGGSLVTPGGCPAPGESDGERG